MHNKTIHREVGAVGRTGVNKQSHDYETDNNISSAGRLEPIQTHTGDTDSVYVHTQDKGSMTSEQI